MTIVWRKVEGVDAYQSCNNAEFLDMNIRIHLAYDFRKEEGGYLCSYTIDGDRIDSAAYPYMESALEWVKTVIIHEFGVNRDALEKAKTNANTG